MVNNLIWYFSEVYEMSELVFLFSLSKFPMPSHRNSQIWLKGDSLLQFAIDCELFAAYESPMFEAPRSWSSWRQSLEPTSKALKQAYDEVPAAEGPRYHWFGVAPLKLLALTRWVTCNVFSVLKSAMVRRLCSSLTRSCVFFSYAKCGESVQTSICFFWKVRDIGEKSL